MAPPALPGTNPSTPMNPAAPNTNPAAPNTNPAAPNINPTTPNKNLVAAAVAASTAYPNSLYRMNDVSKTLNLTPDQITRLNAITANTQARYRDDYGKLGTLSDADRAARIAELNQKYNADWNKSAQNVLDDTQRSRYQQIYYQHGGFNAFQDPDVQKQLNLSADQLKNLQDQRVWNSQQLAAIQQTAATDPTKANQMYRDFWNARQERMGKFLTPDQQKAWGQMTGEPHTPQVYTP
jgi:hypothetical protein